MTSLSTAVIRKLNPVLNGWCTYFRVGNSNRTSTKWTGRCGASCSYGSGANISALGGLLGKRWNYQFLS